MQNKNRLVLIIVLLVVLAASAFLIWVVLPMYRTSPPAANIQQPPGLPSGQQPQEPYPATGTPTQPPVKLSPEAQRASDNERQEQDKLKRMAMDFASRSASYASVDGFASIRDVFSLATKDVQTYLTNVQKGLQTAHPAKGVSWGVNTQSLAPRITSGIPVLSSDTVQAVVQVSQTTETKGQATSVYREATITYTKQDGAWLVSKISWQDIAQP